MLSTAQQKSGNAAHEQSDAGLRVHERAAEGRFAQEKLNAYDKEQPIAEGLDINGLQAKTSPPIAPRNNYSYQRITAKSVDALPWVQPKLKSKTKQIDEYEEEAEQVATQVLAMPDHDGIVPRITRTNQPLYNRGKSENVAAGTTQHASQHVLQSALRSSGVPLAAATRRFMEQRFGYDFSKIRVHNDVLADQSAQSLGALAYTHGHHIFFAAGNYQPGTESGKHLLAHELAHTIQQTGGTTISEQAAQPIQPDSDQSPAFIGDIQPGKASDGRVDSAQHATQPVLPATHENTGTADRGGDYQAIIPAPVAIHLMAPGNAFLLKEAPSLPQNLSAPVAASPEPPATNKSSKEESETSKTNKASAAKKPARDTSKPGTVASDAAQPTQKKAGGGVAPKKETKQAREKIQLDSSDSQALLHSLAAAPPTDFIAGVKDAGPLVAAVQQKEKKDLQDSLPEIEQPTGLPVKGSDAAKKKQAVLAKGNVPDLKAANGPKAGKSVLAEPTPLARPVSVVTVATPRATASNGKADDAFKHLLRQRVSQLPTEDESISTSAGERPEIDLTGEADVSQNEANMSLASEEVSRQQESADAAVLEDFGENDIYPEIKPEMMHAIIQSPSGLPGQSGAAEVGDLPDASEELMSSFDSSMRDSMAEQVDAELAKNDQKRQEMDEASAKERADGQEKIDKETARVRKEQEAAQSGARTEVDAQRSSWKEENEKVMSEYSDGSTEAKNKCDQDIDDKVAETDRDVEAKYSAAEQEAEAEKQKTEREAAEKKRKAEQESEEDSGFWDGLVDAISDFFDALKEAINSLFNKLRELVKAVIDKVKQVVNDLIDLARDLIVGFIKALGEALKALVNIALAAFPEIAERINKLIDKAVDAAVEAVNEFADALKKAVSALLDLIGAALDAILAAYQAFFNLLVDALKFIAVGLLKILEGIANLVSAAYESPDHFWAQVSVELIGQDITNPLPNEVGYVKEADETQIGNGFETMHHLKGLAGIKEEEPAPAGDEALTSDDIVNPEVVDNLVLDPALDAQISAMGDGASTEFGHSAESEEPEAVATMPEPVASIQAPVVTDVPAVAQAGGPTVGPFKNAWERGQYVLGQIKEGISQWWDKNSGKVIAGIVVALAAGIILEVVTGGAITAAIPVLLEIVAALFAVQDIIDAGVFIGQYLTKSWVGEIAAGAMSLARAFVKIIMAFIFDLIGGGEIMKGIKSGIKAAEKGGVKGAVAFGKGVVKNAITKQVKNFAKLGKIAKGGATAVVKNGKLVLSGIRSGLKSGAKSLGELAEKLLAKFRFKRFRIRIKGLRFFLEGEVNPWILLASGELKHMSQEELRAATGEAKASFKVGDKLALKAEGSAIEGIVVGSHSTKGAKTAKEAIEAGGTSSFVDDLVDIADDTDAMKAQFKALNDAKDPLPLIRGKSEPAWLKDPNISAAAKQTAKERGKLRTALGTKAGEEAHHVINVSTIGESKLLQDAIDGGFAFNTSANGINLKKYSKTLGLQGVHASHDLYDANIRRVLQFFETNVPGYTKDIARKFTEKLSAKMIEKLETLAVGKNIKVNDLFRSGPGFGNLDPQQIYLEVIATM